MTELRELKIRYVIAGILELVGLCLLIWVDWKIGLGVLLALWGAKVDRSTDEKIRDMREGTRRALS